MRLTRFAVTGESMTPTLWPGDWLLVRLRARVRARDLVVARPPGGDRLVVKRAIHHDADGWWLESDNQRAPGRRDSWDFGAVPDDRIVGRVVLRYWPLLRRRAGRSPR